MRAAPAGGPRVMRLGLVRGGRVLEERVLKHREVVTVGSNENNTFVVTANRIPHEFRLFDVEHGRYVLQFTDAMSGKVALPDGLKTLAELKGSAQSKGDCHRLTLPEDVRGKVVIGDCAFLFQFVSPPPAQAKPQLPVSVMRGAVGIDWATTMIAAFSFLAHFMAMGAIYSDWLDPVLDYDVKMATLLESVRNLPPPPEVEEKNVEDKEDKKEEADKAPEAKPIAKVMAKEPAKTKMSKAEVAALAEQLDSFDMGILGAQTGKTATSDILSSSDSIDTGIMDKAAASNAGVSAGGPGGLNLGVAGGALQRGEGGISLNQVGEVGKTTNGSGKVQVVEGPKGSANVGSANVQVGQVSDASRVVARMRPGFHQCYTNALSSNPDAAGKITLKIQVGASGAVTGVTASVSGNLPAEVVNCVKRRASGGKFSPPEGGTAVIDVPVSFVKQ
jgi:hypothetical protein